MDWNPIEVGNALQTGLVVLLAIGAIVLFRTLLVVIYLPFHLAMNRRGVPMEKREAAMSWIGPGFRLLVMAFALLAPLLLR